MIEKFLDFIRSNRLFHEKEPVLLAVSGGVDSVVMSHLFHNARLLPGIAHINFRLRGQDSDDDETFVQSIAKKFNVPFFVTRFETLEYARENNISVQMAARELRYSWLEKMRKENGFHAIATAHHQDDSIETVLLNMFRGTGIHGLHGIRPKQGKVVRPLLPFFKHELIKYAGLHGIPFREDPSNATVEYDRNKIRLEIIPSIEKNYPSFQQTFAENIQRWADADWMYDQMIVDFRKKLLEAKGEEVFISISRLQQYPILKTLLYELLREFAFTAEQADQIAGTLNSIPGKIFYSPSHRLLRDRKQLIISKASSSITSVVSIAQDDRSATLPAFRLKIEMKGANSFTVPKDPSISCLDFQELEFPLLLRKWKKGDYFYPLGMKKKKKISDYLIDRKIPMHEKENIWLIESGKRIACIIGERIDERFKVTASTKQVWIIQRHDRRHT